MTHAALRPTTSRWVDNETNTLRSYGIAVCVVIAFLLLLGIRSREYVRVIAFNIPTSVMKVIDNVRIPTPPQLDAGGSSGGAHSSNSSGGVKPVFKLVIPTEPDVEPSDWTEVGHHSNSNNQATGTGTDTASTHSTNVGGVDTTVDEEPFSPLEQEPSFSMDELRASVHYPELARRMQVEGRVVVRAYITAAGTIGSTEIASSDNSLLDAAAVQGVRHITYTPARQNGSAVGCWVYIPVSFELSK